jgi:hypothetical protein
MHTQKHQKMSMDSWHGNFFWQIVAFKHLRAFLHKEMFEELNTMVGGSILHLCG